MFKKSEEKIAKKEAARIAKEEKKAEKLKIQEEKLEKSMAKYNEYQAKANFAKNTIMLELLGGHPEIKPKTVIIKPTMDNQKILVDKKEVDVLNVAWDEKGKRSIGKAAIGALAGGVIALPVAVAGAAIGARKKDDSVAVVNFLHEGLELTMYFRCNQDKYQKLVNAINYK